MAFGSRNCSYCSSIASIGKNISSNSLECTCHNCGKGYILSLLPLKKEIIYLDQNFFSNACKKKPPEFLKRADRLSDLAIKQLVICPYSEAHDKETHFGSKSKNLWEFIKKTSRGKRFYLQTKIERQQLINAYISFLRNDPKKVGLNLYDAITPNIHDWDETLRVEVDWSVTNIITPILLKQTKKRFTDGFLNALPQWRNSVTTFEEDYNLEIRHRAYFLLEPYLRLSASRDIQQILESESYGRINTLLDIGGGNISERLNKIISFLNSEYFSNIPYINISAGLWAIIKREIKEKRWLPAHATNHKRIEAKIQGINEDINHLTVFAPYCDAIFTEKTMARWLNEWCHHALGGYKLKVFSVSNWSDFDTYLDEIEKNVSQEMKEELEIVYGG